MTKEIILTKGKVATVDDHQYERVSRFNWYATETRPGKWYACSHSKGVYVYLHRLLTNAPEGMEVDHKDGNGLNCTEENMRICTHAQNISNRKKQANNISGYTGVHWDKNKEKWVAYIKASGERIHLGYFENQVDAARARDTAAIKYHGEFAVLNFPLTLVSIVHTY